MPPLRQCDEAVGGVFVTRPSSSYLEYNGAAHVRAHRSDTLRQPVFPGSKLCAHTTITDEVDGASQVEVNKITRHFAINHVTKTAKVIGLPPCHLRSGSVVVEHGM